MLYSIIIPCYKSAASISEVVTLTMNELDMLGRTPYEFILVDDYSPDNGETVAALHSLADRYDCVKSIELAQNAGQHNAIMAGLNYSVGDCIILMDDDMQTHPSQLRFLLDELDKGYDLVFGYYPDKKHSLFRRFGTWVNYTSVRVLIGKPKDMKTSSFCVFKKFVRDEVIKYRGQYSYMQGLFLRTTRNISSVPIQHFERSHGTSGYTFRKLLKLWSNIMGFSIVPLRIARNTGIFFSAVGILGAITVIIRKLIMPYTTIGWASTMVAICFFSGMIMLFLGLIGEYIGRMFQAMGNSPQYVIRKVYTGISDEKLNNNDLDYFTRD